MTELLITRDILTYIMQEHVPFSDALKRGMEQSNNSVNQGLVRSLTSCELHHHRLLTHVVQRYLPTLPLADQLVVQIALGNNVFVRRLPNDTVQQFIKSFLIEKAIDPVVIDQLLTLAQPGQMLMDATIKEQSVAYLGIKYNTPEWLVVMWIKHFGFSTTIKLLNSNNKPVLQACRVNTLKITTQALLQKYPELVAGPLEDTVIYQRKEPLKNHPAYQDNLIFQQRLAVTDIINTFSFEHVKGEMLIVETRPQALYLELPVYTKQQIKINVVTNSIERKLAMQKSLASFGLQSVSLFESQPEGMIAHLPKKQDVVMVVPQCSKFDLIRSLPDFFIHFKQTELDGFIAHQKLALKEASQFVEDGGLLFYGVNTLNHKEGKFLIQEFVEQNPAYKLIHEVQYYPFDHMNTALYVAAMRKQK